MCLHAKLLSTNSHSTPERVEKGLNQTLEDLGLDYLDLYLMRWPVGKGPDEEKYYYDYIEVPHPFPSNLPLMTDTTDLARDVCSPIFPRSQHWRLQLFARTTNGPLSYARKAQISSVRAPSLPSASRMGEMAASSWNSRDRIFTARKHEPYLPG